jgi:hypothetical protein
LALVLAEREEAGLGLENLWWLPQEGLVLVEREGAALGLDNLWWLPREGVGVENL